MTRLPGLIVALAGLALAGPRVEPQFTDITGSSGIAFRHAASKTSAKFLPETMGGGVALLDYDGDGRLDVFFTNGAAIDAQMTSARQPDKRDARFWNRLYRNRGDGTFVDVTTKAGVAGHRYDFGAAVADVDNDGDADLYVTGYGGNTLYRNRGDGTFADVTFEAGVGADGWSASAAFVDYDQDGWVDLFVGRYLSWSWEANIPCPAPDGTGRAYCHPQQFPPIANLLYRNNRDGTFSDVSRESGIAALEGKALGVALNDYDGDGWVDLFVANDSMRQFLFRNAGEGMFVEVALDAGTAYDEDGRAFAGMGTDFEDYDNDGRPDLIVTTLSLEHYALYRNAGNGRFDYATHTTGVGRATALLSGWGTKFVDFDNDTDRDLFVAQGHVLDGVTRARQGYDYLQPPLMLRNDGGSFVDVSAALGPPFARAAAGRGAAFGDLDDDGDIDIVVANLDSPPAVLRNDGGNAHGWLRLRLRGTASNRDGLGARVTVVDANGHTQWAVSSTASSYQSASDRQVHFGLGAAAGIRRIEVRWPSGATQVLNDITANREIEVIERRDGR
ncbi:MAG: CRTAC1 family protein [Vicinamibacteraceae bacterium]